MCHSVQRHLEVVGRRWNSAILLAGMRGARRFGEYRAMVAGVSDRLLAQRFVELQHEGLIERTVVPTTPVTVSYELTERGRGLMTALEGFTRWAVKDQASYESLREVSS